MEGVAGIDYGLGAPYERRHPGDRGHHLHHKRPSVISGTRPAFLYEVRISRRDHEAGVYHVYI